AFGKEFERLHSRPMALRDLDERQLLITAYYINGRYMGPDVSESTPHKVEVVRLDRPLPTEARIRFIYARTGLPIPGLKFHLGFNAGLPSRVTADDEGSYVFTPPQEKPEMESTPDRMGRA